MPPCPGSDPTPVDPAARELKRDKIVVICHC
jgi:hypothetical protein